MAFVCHIISSEGVEVDPRKMSTVRNSPRQLTPTDIRSFLGLLDYYPRIVDIFASIASPLTTLTKNSKKFELSKACEMRFKLLKDRLTSAPVLTLIEGTKGFVVYCDATHVGLGCVLMQHWKVISFASR